MTIESVNPATGERLARFDAATETDLERALAEAAEGFAAWSVTPLAERTRRVGAMAEVLRGQKDRLAGLITREMGKLREEARGEIDKCAWVCEYYALNAAAFLADEPIETDASTSYVGFQPLGTILAIMPWNFPFWQLFRCAVPAVTAGNTLILKHASNVPQCALAIEEVFREAGFPEGVFQSVLARAQQIGPMIADDRVQGISLTGSEAAGRKVAEVAGRHVKKCVLELGGSDPCVVLADADLDAAARVAAQSRMINGGQSCIAAKRFIVVEAVAEDFVARFRQHIESLAPGDPAAESTTLAPLARADLRTDLDAQVQGSLVQGARLVTGGHPLDRPGFFYAPTLLDSVMPGMPAFDEEVFGPAAAVIRAHDEAEALRLANASRYGLGGSVWSGDRERGERFARAMACGCAAVNGLVKSDPRLPFGGIKASGYGRELSMLGIREFVNAKSVWIA
jgi:succinate-semialdehyde dehydrogenase/glutarate-semialdehyde dehydrogenase